MRNDKRFAARLEALERTAAQRRAKRGNGDDAMDRIMSKLSAISARLQDAGIEFEPLSAAALSERLVEIRARMRGNGR